jgi:DNA-binding response OmpR family regulator
VVLGRGVIPDFRMRRIPTIFRFVASLKGDGSVRPQNDSNERGWLGETSNLVNSSAVGERLHRARILLVDDHEEIVEILALVLERAGYHQVTSTTEPREVLALYGEFQPDLVVLDLHMPHLDGFQVMEELCRQIPEGAYLPILVLTADLTPEARLRALAMGARDYLTKPFNETEVLLRIRNVLETRFLYLQAVERAQSLEAMVGDRTKDLTDRLARAERVSEHRRSLLSRLTRRGPGTDGPTSAGEERVGSRTRGEDAGKASHG